MPTDLEQVLAASLRDRADAGSPIDPVPVMRSAVARGQRLRRRRRVAGGLVAAAVVAAAGVYGVAATQRGAPVAGPRPGASVRGSAPASVDLALLPAAATASALARPELVGTDPRVVHFSVDEMAAASWLSRWHVTAAYESADIQREDYQAYVAVSRDAAALPPAESFLRAFGAVTDPPVDVRVGDRPATLTVGRLRPTARRGPASPDPTAIWSLVWQPAAGLWANVQVQTTSLDRALQVAGLVRFDRAKRCALPFRLETPAGSAVAECAVTLSADRGHIFGQGSLTFRDGTGTRTLTVRASNNWMHAGEFPRDLKAGGYLVDEDPHSANWTMTVKDMYVDAIAHGAQRWPYTREQVLAALATVEIARRVEDPATWY